MQLLTPPETPIPAWEGELEAEGIALETKAAGQPTASLGKVEIWSAAQAVEELTGQKWVPPAPLGDWRDYWLVRFACTLYPPPPRQSIHEARHALILRPKNRQAPPGSVYAFSLYPDRLGIESESELTFSLAPGLTFASGAGGTLGGVGLKIPFRKIFPVIQSYAAGEAMPYWVFQPHAVRPLQGSQFLYAVLAVGEKSGGLVGEQEMKVEVQTKFGPVHYKPPRTAAQHLRFEIPGERTEHV